MDRPVDHQFRHAVAGRLGNRSQPIDQVVVLLSLLALEHRVAAAAVVGTEDLVAADLAGQQPLHQRPIGQHCHAVAAAPGEQVGLDLPHKHAVGRLEGGHGAGGSELLELRQRKIGRSHRPRLPFLHQPSQFAGRFGHRDILVWRVKIEQLDLLGLQPPQALFALPPQRGRPGVVQLLALRAPVQPALRGDHHFAAAAAERAGDQSLALAGPPIDVGRVEMVDAQIETRPDGGDALVVAGAGAGHSGDWPAAQGDFGDFHSRIAERPITHGHHILKVALNHFQTFPQKIRYRVKRGANHRLRLYSGP